MFLKGLYGPIVIHCDFYLNFVIMTRLYCVQKMSQILFIFIMPNINMNKTVSFYRLFSKRNPTSITKTIVMKLRKMI